MFLAAFAVISSPALAQKTLRVAAAADLQPVLPGMLSQYEKASGLKIEASYQSSATLATQIQNGAPFDLFLSADFSFPEKLIAAGMGDSAQPVLYAKGALVLWARKDSNIGTPRLDSLKDPSVRRIAIANPDHAPYGRAAKAALTHLGLFDSLQSKLVIAENIAQTAQFVDSGNADLGLISLTSALSDRLRTSGNYVEIPRDDYPPILQGAVVMKNSPNSRAAHDLLDYLLSPKAQRQFVEHGLAAAK